MEMLCIGKLNIMQSRIYLGTPTLDDEINWECGFHRNGEKLSTAACRLVLERMRRMQLKSS
jgi:hypothetical protein